jgi:hypothetical protein
MSVCLSVRSFRSHLFADFDQTWWVCLVGALGNTGSLTSSLRPLSAEKSTKKRRFVNISRFDFLKI